MTSASKEKIIRTQKSFNFGTKCMCNFLVVVLCWLPEKCEPLRVFFLNSGPRSHDF